MNCDYDCEGSSLCTLEVNGNTIVFGGVNFMDGDDPVDVTPEEKEVKIQCKDLRMRDEGNNNKASVQNDPNQESTITLRSSNAGGTPFYPASVSVQVQAVVQVNGDEFYSDTPIQLESDGVVEFWPSESALDYVVVDDASFEGAAGQLVIKAGSTVRMQAAQ